HVNMVPALALFPDPRDWSGGLHIFREIFPVTRIEYTHFTAKVLVRRLVGVSSINDSQRGFIGGQHLSKQRIVARFKRPQPDHLVWPAIHGVERVAGQA